MNSLEKEAYILSKLMNKVLPSVHKSFLVSKNNSFLIHLKQLNFIGVRLLILAIDSEMVFKSLYSCATI